MSKKPNNSNIVELVSLAGDNSVSGREQLLSRVTDLFIDSADALNDKESSHLEGILDSLARTVGTNARQNLGRRIGDLGNAPRAVIMRLANDGISVARPVLTASPNLENEDLIKIVGIQTQEHLLAISTRPNLHESVSDALAENGNDDVLLSLALNLGANLSRATAAHLVGSSQSLEPLQIPLVERSDIPPDLIFQIYWWAQPIVRKKILGLTENFSTPNLEKLMGNNGNSGTNDITCQEGALSPAQEFVREMASNDNLTENALTNFLRGGQVPEFVIALAHLSKLNLVTARRVLQDNDSESLAMVCIANGFDKQTFTELNSMVHGNHKQKQKSVFDEIDPAIAKTALAMWRQGPDAVSGAGEWPPKDANIQSAQYINVSGQKLKMVEE